jgi:selenophosphate synthetase-related protein
MSKMIEENFIWQCKCGHIEHSDAMPEDCSKCLSIAKFKKIPEEMADEILEEQALSIEPEEDEEELDESLEDD